MSFAEKGNVFTDAKTVFARREELVASKKLRGGSLLSRDCEEVWKNLQGAVLLVLRVP